MALSLPQLFNGKTTIIGSDLDDNFNAIIAKFGASITSADLSPSAAIGLGQITATYEHRSISLMVQQVHLAGGWPAAGLLCVVPIPSPLGAGEAPWIVRGTNWFCNDTGTGTGTFAVQWGEIQAGAWSVAAAGLGNVATGVISNIGGAVEGGVAAPGPVTSLTFSGANTRSLGLVATGLDAATLAVGNLYNCFTATVFLSRQIATT